jgi:hypothetical protein
MKLPYPFPTDFGMKRYLWIALALIVTGCVNSAPHPRRGDWQCVSSSCESTDKVIWPADANAARETKSQALPGE